MPKTSYTNADLVGERPALTMTREFSKKIPPRAYKPNRDVELLDQFLESGDSVEEMLAHARQVAARPRPDAQDRIRAGVNEAAKAQSRAEEASHPLGAITQEWRENPAGMIERGALTGAGIMSLASGAPGALASVPLSVAALADFAEDPSLMGAGGVALTALPGYRALRGAKEAATVAPALAKSRYTASRLRQTAPEAGGTVGVGSRGQVMPFGKMPLKSAEEQQRILSEVTKRQMTRARGSVKPAGARPSLRWAQLPEPNKGILPDEIEAQLNSIPNESAPWPTNPVSTTMPTVRRFPMGATGDEYAEVRKLGKGKNLFKEAKAARQAELPDDVLQYLLEGFGR